MPYRVTVMPYATELTAEDGQDLLHILRSAGILADAPCGGNGTCGKCKVLVDGQEVLACRTHVHGDMTVTVPMAGDLQILAQGLSRPTMPTGPMGPLLAIDIGTTTVAAYLLDGHTGRELACDSIRNPQAAFGADVISRIRHALRGHAGELTSLIRQAIHELTQRLCRSAGISPNQIHTVSIVGNPAMQQLYLGLPLDNLARLPFAPLLTKANRIHAAAYLPLCPDAQLLIVPDISGFVGADTIAAILATNLHKQDKLTLLVDIGTNGEMVLGNCHRMVACSTAAGPALEGANIQYGTQAQQGAIDHVRLENENFNCSVIGGGRAIGICGSGLMDAAASALDADLINARGRILREDRLLPLAGGVSLNQDDIRQLQMAKGAIAAGIELMAAHLGVSVADIDGVYLAGAFGTFLDPASACRIGLLPPVLEEKITAVGNAAGSGAKLLAADPAAFDDLPRLIEKIEFLELAALPGFQRCFAEKMRFDTTESYWISKALALGFTNAVPMNTTALMPRQDVREMCAADKCGAYGKNWTCPPHCGTLEQCREEIGRYHRGILLQTVGTMTKTIDTKAYRRTEQRHLEQFHALAASLRRRYPDALCLGSGGCRICKKCAWPEPCHFPEKACSSMEGYGLFVTDVCRDNGCAYHHGEKTITYTACILF